MTAKNILMVKNYDDLVYSQTSAWTFVAALGCSVEAKKPFLNSVSWAIVDLISVLSEFSVAFKKILGASYNTFRFFVGTICQGQEPTPNRLVGVAIHVSKRDLYQLGLNFTVTKNLIPVPRLFSFNLSLFLDNNALSSPSSIPTCCQLPCQPKLRLSLNALLRSDT